MFRAPVMFACVVGLATSSVQAVVVATGDGSQNTTAPADDFGFANVGRVFNTTNGFYNSGVYLGNGWVLTAYHVVRNPGETGFLFGSVVFKDPILGDTTFAVNPATAVRLQNSDSTFADLAMFQLASVPTFLSGVTIASSLPLPNATIYMAGNGLNRQSDLTYWEIDGSEVWTESGAPGDAAGYREINGSQTIRWGTNTLEAGTFAADIGFGPTTFFRTDFDNTANEAQSSAGDSGGAVFYKRGSQWELIGILNAASEQPGQPSFSAVFGNETYSVSLPTYRDQIVSIVPEPATAHLALAGAALLLRWRPRRSS